VAAQLERDVAAATAAFELQGQEELGDQFFEALRTALRQLADQDPAAQKPCGVRRIEGTLEVR
jgi:hypothetical protein